MSGSFLWSCLFFNIFKQLFFSHIFLGVLNVERLKCPMDWFLIHTSITSFSYKKIEHVSSQQLPSAGAFVIMALCFAALLVLCLSVGSLETTTKPQKQDSSASKYLCEASTKVLIRFTGARDKTFWWVQNLGFSLKRYQHEKLTLSCFRRER